MHPSCPEACDMYKYTSSFTRIPLPYSLKIATIYKNWPLFSYWVKNLLEDAQKINIKIRHLRELSYIFHFTYIVQNEFKQQVILGAVQICSMSRHKKQSIWSNLHRMIVIQKSGWKGFKSLYSEEYSSGHPCGTQGRNTWKSTAILAQITKILLHDHQHDINSLLSSSPQSYLA